MPYRPQLCDSHDFHTACRLVGSLLGTAVGDALGLPYEGLSPRRAARLLGPPDRYRLFPGRGMVSDDTEHACIMAQALIASGADVEAFRRDLARRLRWWLLACPAGTGLATLRATLKLWLGISPKRSGVWSAGNGPCMRAPILGVAVDDLEQLRQLVEASTIMTHTDPEALCGAMAVALAAHCASRRSVVTAREFLTMVRQQLPSPAADELLPRLEMAAASVLLGEDTPTFAANLGLSRGVSGYVMHTVPIVIHAWLRYPRDYAAASPPSSVVVAMPTPPPPSSAGSWAVPWGKGEFHAPGSINSTTGRERVNGWKGWRLTSERRSTRGAARNRHVWPRRLCWRETCSSQLSYFCTASADCFRRTKTEA